jgi:uncharacterized protein YbjQ (UPF0145 family)
MTNKNQQHKKGRLKAKQRAFLAVYSEAGNISQAAELANVNRCMHYTWMEKSEVYREAFEEAMEKAADRLEQEARRRAVNGVSEPVFYKGEQCGTIQRYSDTLLIFLLKGVRPEKYRERFGHEITVKMLILCFIFLNISFGWDTIELTNVSNSLRRQGNTWGLFILSAVVYCLVLLQQGQICGHAKPSIHLY